MIEYKVNDTKLLADKFILFVNQIWKGNYDLNKTTDALSKTINITVYNKKILFGYLKILADSYYFKTQPGIETFYKNDCKKFYNLILLKNEFNYNNIILTRIANYIFLYI